MNAIILSIGDELTTGLTTNTNAAWLGRKLSILGIHCRLQLTVGDQQAAIIAAIRECLGHCDFLLITGGLGPTKDDVTRSALAEAIGQPLVRDDAALRDLEAFFERIGRTMTANNRLQALRPASARCITNSCGTAPGIIARSGNTEIFVMPGVPKEMMAMFEHALRPILEQVTGSVIQQIGKLNICGVGESWVGEQIADLMLRGVNPSVGTTVHDGIVSVRIYATGPRDKVAAMVAQKADVVRRRLGALIFSEDDVTLEQVIAAQLIRRRETIATAESCTGGMVAMMLTDVPGSSHYFSRGWITYSNQSKTTELGIDAALIDIKGAVSPEVAKDMAIRAREKAGSHWGIGITGIAGPDGGTTEKPVGLVYIGIASAKDGGQVYVRRCNFPGDRQSVRLRASQMALTLLRLKLEGLDPESVLRQ